MSIVTYFFNNFQPMPLVYVLNSPSLSWKLFMEGELISVASVNVLDMEVKIDGGLDS